MKLIICALRSIVYLDKVLVDRVYFFFSSRRRHTRLQGDWSSDVCSSDLDHYVVHDNVRSGYALPGRAEVGGLPQTLSGSCVNNLLVVRVLLQHAGAAR